MTQPLKLLLTAEHAGNRVPARYAKLFHPHRRLLQTHRAYDRGTLHLARQIARRFSAPFLFTDVTRLLVDHNRSATNPAVFSFISRSLSSEQRRRLMDHYHQRHLQRVHHAAAQLIHSGPLLHLAVHSFTPRLRGVTRNADVGLLYDPKRPRERTLALRWKQAIVHAQPTCSIRLNYPYRGNSDGLTTILRRRFPASRYLGIELEINQRALDANGRLNAVLQSTLLNTLSQFLHND